MLSRLWIGKGMRQEAGDLLHFCLAAWKESGVLGRREGALLPRCVTLEIHIYMYLCACP